MEQTRSYLHTCSFIIVNVCQIVRKAGIVHCLKRWVLIQSEERIRISHYGIRRRERGKVDMIVYRTGVAIESVVSKCSS